MNGGTAVVGGALASVLAVAFLAIGAAKIAGVESMRERATHLGFGVGKYRWIGMVEVAGALVIHARNGDTAKDLYPALGLGVVATASLILYTSEALS